ncbi:iron-containing alcohol dehydrogenase [Clostridium vincentii]|uniref:NADH-dependent butanol dehydrogenase A n=1 Tax=Clostridium vincentii TaxID=52704 RepID=A0A2T0BEX4_9CLOT|nr:iron-containing alcohol dehydrogenase [Clostridium vincentii]PRR82419.1 NADH-dependent butanol dehydrogenase A [Clostridium vincentii]
MINFNYQNKTKIIFGKGQHKGIGALIKPYSNKILLHYGGGSIKKSGIYDEVIASLKAENIEIIELAGVKPNPRLTLVREGIELCRKNDINFILAVGGGSVIDSSKAISMGVSYPSDVWQLFETGKKPVSALNIGTILTIPAAGSESSGNSVITNEEKQLKIGYGSELLKPVFSVINPEICLTLPHNQMANGVSDMMSHIMERYFTNTLHTDVIDGLCESVLRTIMKNGRTLNKNLGNYDAWAEICLGGNIAHNGLLGVGRDQDWACHAMEHELSAIYDIPHGAGLAILTPFWMRYVCHDNMNMFLQFAVNVMGVEGGFRDQEEIVMEGINRLEAFYKELSLPTTLVEVKIDKTNLEIMAKKAAGNREIGGLKILKWQDVLNIYQLAL